MKKMILLFSHRLNEKQRLDAETTFEVREFISLPQELQKMWSNVDPDAESVEPITEPIKEFLQKSASENDIVLVQGDFGLVYHIVSYCKQNKFIPVYATTKRNSVEYSQNNQNFKKSVFEFRRFREYE